MTTAPQRIAIIGGGLTGLAAAHRVIELASETHRPVEVTVFEASERLGGVVGTRRIDEYLVELGADSFITNKPWGVDLIERLGLGDELIPTDDAYRRSLVLRKGRPQPVPDGFMLLAPAKVWPILTSPVFSPLGKLRMGCEYLIPRRSETGDESLASFVRRRFGREALDRLVQPLVGGIYTSDPEKLSLQATMPRFQDMERDDRSLIRASRKRAKETDDLATSGSGARYGLFATLKGGLSDLFNALESRVEQAGEIRLRTAVTKLMPSENSSRRWRLTTSDGSAHEFDAVIAASRAYQVAELVGGFDVQLGNSLREIEYASSAIVVTGHRLADIKNPLDAFGLVVPAIENRQILAVSFTSRKFPGRAPEGHVLLRTFVGGAMQPELLEHDDDRIIEIVRGELSSILGVSGEPDFSVVARYENAMPQYHVGHLDRVAQINARVDEYPGLALAGNAYHGVGVPDCIHSAENAAQAVMDQLSETT